MELAGRADRTRTRPVRRRTARGLTHLGSLALLLALAATTARAGEAAWRIAGRAGTLCDEGEKYEAVRIDEGWRALCYQGDLDEARRAAGADPRAVSSLTQGDICMTCNLDTDLKIEALILLRRLNWESLE